MAFDPAGTRLKEIMEGKDLAWLDPPNPTWRIEPPNLFRWILKLGFSVSNYDDRFVKLLAEIISSYPGAYVTYSHAPESLQGDWKEADLDEPSWKGAETGSYVRALDGKDPAWVIPADADAKEVAMWLSRGAWSIWKPAAKKRGLPRHLAQSTFQTVLDCEFEILVTSSWENQFTEISIHPEHAGEAAAAA